MSKVPSGFDPKVFEQKSGAMRLELERAKLIAAHRAKLLEPRLKRTAITQSPESHAEAKSFLESMAKFSPPADERPSLLRKVPYDLGWRDIDRGKQIEWYGPDLNTGHCGGKLVSQAEGDFTAFCSVGVWCPKNGSSNHISTVSWTTLLGFCDAGNFDAASAFSKTYIGLSVDIHDPDERQYASMSHFVNGASVDAGAINYDQHSYSDSGTLQLPWSGDPNATFSVWANVKLQVGTFGPAGAQANLHIIFTDIDPG
jgi:hypothetical protein